MKLAFVHDRIVHLGGGEAVLQSLIDQKISQYNLSNKDSKLFVLYSTQKYFSYRQENNSPSYIVDNSSDTTLYSIEIVTALPTWINNIFSYFAKHRVPVLSTVFDYRNLMFWFPVLCSLLRKKIEKFSPDETLISSFAAVKNIVPEEKTHTIIVDKNQTTYNDTNNTSHHKLGKTTLYLHSPMQYIRENYNENVKKLRTPIKQLYQFAATYLRPRDKKPRHYDVVLCNSDYTAKLAKQLYGLEGATSYPQIHPDFAHELPAVTPKNYFIFVGRVQKYVREIDTIIQACNESGINLLVVGDGPDMEYVRSIAGPTILFVGKISDTKEKIDLMKYAIGMINVAKESFGIATAESLCLGVPVLGYNQGATPELVDTTNGLLLDNKSVEDITAGIKDFLGKEFDRSAIAQKSKNKFF